MIVYIIIIINYMYCVVCYISCMNISMFIIMCASNRKNTAFCHFFMLFIFVFVTRTHMSTKKTMLFEFQLKLKRLKPIIMVIDFRYKCRNEWNRHDMGLSGGSLSKKENNIGSMTLLFGQSCVNERRRGEWGMFQLNHNDIVLWHLGWNAAD